MTRVNRNCRMHLEIDFWTSGSCNRRKQSDLLHAFARASVTVERIHGV